MLKAKETASVGKVDWKDLRTLGFHLPALTDTISISAENKKCHLWLHGPRNSGKTYFIERLMELGIRLYQGPYNNDWSGFEQDFH